MKNLKIFSFLYGCTPATRILGVRHNWYTGPRRMLQLQHKMSVVNCYLYNDSLVFMYLRFLARTVGFSGTCLYLCTYNQPSWATLKHCPPPG